VPNLRTDTILLGGSGSNPPAKGATVSELALLQSLVQELRQSNDAAAAGDGKVKAFDWITRRPTPIYYPTYATQSLDDTPEIYVRTQSKDVHLRRSLQHYLETHGARDLAQMPEYNTSNVGRYITHTDLSLLDLFDVFQNNNFEFYTEHQRCSSSPLEISVGRASSTHSKAGSNKRGDMGGAFEDYETTVLNSLNDSVGF